MGRNTWTWPVLVGLALAMAGCDGASQTAGRAAQNSPSNQSLAIQASPPTSVTAGSTYNMQVQVQSTAKAAVSFSIRHKPGWAVFSTSSGAMSGTPTAADVGTYPNIIVSASNGAASASLPPFSVTVTTTATAAAGSSASTAAGTATRPSYNSGNGFFVLNGALYDSKGNQFRIRGVNRLHWDSSSAAGIALSGANTVRWDMDFTQPAANNVSEIQTQGIDNRSVPIVGNWTTTCSTDPNALSAAVQTWVSQASEWTQLNPYLILNVANEWGPADSTVWSQSYIKAIASLRTAGYTGPILIDSGGCGQDIQDLTQYSQAVFNSDPEKNVMFALHMYGSTNNYSASIQSVQQGNPTVITLAGDSPTHPFASGYNGTGNSWNGMSAYEITGVQGMTQLNGAQPSLVNVGGYPGAWTITLSVDSSNWPAYTGGGTVVDYNGNYAVLTQRLAALSKQTGAVYIIGEFGPGDDIGPSPTMVTPGQIITAAEANGVGWLAWAWDDMDLANCKADNHWFSMTYSCGMYAQPSDLTTYGQDVVLNPTYGLSVIAKSASIF
jgi:ribosomal protein L31